MSDDKSKPGDEDRARINLSEPYEVRSWANKFGVSKEELMSAVKSVGNSVSAVQAHLMLSNK